MNRPVRKILVRGVNWLGDAVMTTPALARLREAHPQATITLLTQSKLRDLWQQHSALDQVIPVEPGEGSFAVGRKLRSHNFDVALLFPNSPRSALEAWWGRVPRRIGGVWPWRNWLLTDPVPHPLGLPRMRKRRPPEVRRCLAQGGDRQSYPEEAHQIFHYLRLAAALGASPKPLAPQLCLSEEEERQNPLPRWTGSAEPGDGHVTWLGLNPGAEYGPAKRWPGGRFAAVANAVHQRTGHRWLILGGKADQPLAEEIAGKVPSAVSLCGKTTLRELMIVLKRCRLVLTNDTGPMHVAAALGVPAVVPFGSTSPELTGPGLPGATQHRRVLGNAPCAPCFLSECPVDFRCLLSVSVEAVVDAVLEVLGVTS